MEKLKSKLSQFEEDIFSGKDIDIKEFYKLKKHLIDTKKDNQDLLELHMILEAMLDKSQNDLMNKRLNLLENRLDMLNSFNSLKLTSNMEIKE